MKAGDKVICVDDNWSRSHSHPAPYFTEIPVAGRVYVVRGFSTAPNGMTCVLLLGITGGHYTKNGQEAGFFEDRFRLLEEMKARRSLASESLQNPTCFAPAKTIRKARRPQKNEMRPISCSFGFEERAYARMPIRATSSDK